MRTSATKPILILLPGMDGTGELFSWFVQSIGSHVDVEIVSYPQKLNQDFESLVSLVKSAIGERDVILLGESFSGPIAIKTASLIPNRIKGLILVSTFATPPLPSQLISLISKLKFSKVPMFLKRFFLLGSNPPKVVKEKFNDVILKCSDEIMKVRTQAVANFDLERGFERLNMPILCLHGKRDLIVQKRLRHKTSSTIIIDAPHMLLQTQPSFASEQIVEFISSIS